MAGGAPGEGVLGSSEGLGLSVEPNGLAVFAGIALGAWLISKVFVNNT